MREEEQLRHKSTLPGCDFLPAGSSIRGVMEQARRFLNLFREVARRLSAAEIDPE
jgi:hypothetical protein